MKPKPRFLVATTLVGMALIALAAWFFLPPRVSFKSKLVSINHLDNGKTSYSVRTDAQNSGWIPVWYRTHSSGPDKIVMGATLDKKSGNLYIENAKWWTWNQLGPGETIELDEPIFENQVPGLLIQDWTGRHFNLFDFLDTDQLKSEFESAE